MEKMPSIPHLDARDSERKSPYSEERLHEKVNDKVDVAQDIQEEVYDDVQAIDLDETGKEESYR